MDDAAEAALLEPYREKARQGQVVEVSEIKAEYEKAVGYSIGRGQIYYVLRRRGLHKSKELAVPENIVLFFIPPYTPEMNPIEQIWQQLRKRGFKNEVFACFSNVIDRLCDTICSLTSDVIYSITARDWVIKCFN